MFNIYLPVYKNLETEFNRLMFDIHVVDEQINVFSVKIADLINRSVMEIESISKSLYEREGGLQKSHLKFDEDCIKLLENKFMLSYKVVNISSLNCFLKNKTLRPFQKNEKRTGTERLTFPFNNAYQNLKHDRGKALSFGSLKYLFEAMSALFLLNIYYIDGKYVLGEDAVENFNLPNILGSELFSIELYTFSKGCACDGSYTKTDQFLEYAYRVKSTEETMLIATASLAKESQSRHITKLEELILIENNKQEPNQEFLIFAKNQIEYYLNNGIYRESAETHAQFMKDMAQLRYEAVIIRYDSKW